MSIKITGTGRYVPQNIITNDDLAKIVETSDEWIYSRTGIKARHVASTETTTSMAVESAAAALKDAGFSAEQLDLIIVASITNDYKMPSTACLVQAALGADRAVAFDLNAACSGFLFALNTAAAYFRAGLYQNALVIGVETLSKIVDWSDRGTCVLFGDGAGAAVVEARKDGCYEMIQFSDGSKAQVLTGGFFPTANFLQADESKIDFVQMNGQEVFKFAVKKVPESILELLDQTQTDISEIKYFILHQANIRIIQSVSKRLGVPMDRCPANLHNYGNTSAASIPLLLDEMNEMGMLKSGDKIVLSGFGGGLTWGASLLEW